MLNAPGKIGAFGGGAADAGVGPPLSVVLAPSTLTWDGAPGAWFLPGNFEATVSNAVGTPLYSWDIVTGQATLSYFQESEGPNVAPINSLGNDENPRPGNVTLRCTVTADNGTAVSNIVTALT